MLLKNSSTISALDFLFKKILLSGMIVFVFFILWPQTASAACCRCTHPEIDGTFCLQNDVSNCDNLAQHNNELANANCKLESKDASCKIIKDGGVCIKDPIPTLSFKLKDFAKTAAPNEQPKSEEKQTAFTPALIDLNTDIPGLVLSNPYLEDNQVIIPYLGQYIQALYKFLLGVGLIAAALMVIIGGYKYIISSTGAKVSEGKETIKDALLGITILLGAYVILSNLNPNLTQFGALTVPFVEEDLFVLSKKDHKSIAGGSSYYNNDENVNTSQVYARAKEKAAEKNIEYCIVEAIIRTESGGKVGVIGHDENFNYVAEGVLIPQARIDFLRSRTYYSGKKFDIDVPVMPANCSGGARATCAQLSKDGPLNDDNEIKMDDFYYGMDTRMQISHGIGLGQLTFWERDRCDGKWGKTIGGKCFTFADLLTLEGGIDAILYHPAVKPGASAEAVFKAYIGKPNPGLLSKKMGAYQLCKQKEGQ